MEKTPRSSQHAFSSSFNLADARSIVAVHGIGAHPDHTWTMKNCEGKWVNWLTDPGMLPQKLPDALIMRFGYRSEWFGSEKVETKNTFVHDVALALLKRLEHCRDASQLE